MDGTLSRDFDCAVTVSVSVSRDKSETSKLEENSDTGEKTKESVAELSDEAEGTCSIPQSFPVSEKIEKLDSEMQIDHENLKKQHQEEREVLKKKYPEEYNDRKRLYNEVIDQFELKGNIRVFCRCRPLNMDEVSNNAQSIVDYSSCQENELQIISSDSSKKLFKFDHVFKPEDNQENIFVQAVPIVTSVLDGFNVCIFAYGQTGTGKTFTMEGTPESRGVNYRTLEELLRVSNERGTFMNYKLLVSMLEVHNEKIRDLLIENDNQPAQELDIKQSAEGTLEVPGLVEAHVYSTDEVWKVLKSGSRARSVGSTNANKLSSRSHCLVRVTVLGENLKNEQRTRSHLWLVDLAGSERVGRLDDGGERLKEAQSLSALGDVISALASKTTNIPYRNSKLTHLLQSSLGGDCKTLIFVQISPNAADVGETICSLNFASGVRGVELPARKQTDPMEHFKQLAKYSRSREDASFSWLSEELIVEVLLRLPVKQLIQLRSVSKLFRNLINCHGDFARSYLLMNSCHTTIPDNIVVNNNNGHTRESRSWKLFLNVLTEWLGDSRTCRFLFENTITLPPKFYLVGCCDGLLCFYREEVSKYDPEICLYNPALSQVRLLPPIGINELASISVCLVFDPQSSDYKVTILACGRKEVMVFIYSLRGNSWRQIPNLAGDLIPTKYFKENVVVHNGNPHWISSWRCKGEDQFIINVLDVHQEVILEVPTPNDDQIQIAYRNSLHNFLVRYRGHLALSPSNLSSPKNSILDLWIRYDDSNTWVKEKINLGIPSEVYTEEGYYRIIFCKMPWASTSWTYIINSDGSDGAVILMDVEDAQSAQQCKGEKIRLNSSYSYCLADYVSSFVSIQPLQEFDQHVIVMRHGDRIDNFETMWDTTISRPWDPPLTCQGKDRAFACGQKLSMHFHFPIHRILVSPFLRCLQTATEIIRGLCATSKVKVAVEYGLCEMLNSIAIKPMVAPKDHDFGFLLSQCESVLPAGTIDHSHEGVREMPLWEESLSDARARYADVVKALADKYPSDNLLLVTHGEGVGSTVAAYSDAAVTEPDYCSYAHLNRSTSIDEWQSWKTGKFTVHVREGENGLSYIGVADLPVST